MCSHKLVECVGCNIARRACRMCEESGVFLFGDVVDVILCDVIRGVPLFWSVLCRLWRGVIELVGHWRLFRVCRWCTYRWVHSLVGSVGAVDVDAVFTLSAGAGLCTLVTGVPVCVVLFVSICVVDAKMSASCCSAVVCCGFSWIGAVENFLLL